MIVVSPPLGFPWDFMMRRRRGGILIGLVSAFSPGDKSNLRQD